MTNRVNTTKLESVLDEYVEATESPTHEDLAEWIRHYPEYEKELTEFTVAWIVMQSMPRTLEPATDKTTLVLRGMSIVQNLLHQKKQVAGYKNQEGPLLAGIFATGKVMGFSFNQLASQLRLSVTLLLKLDQRVIVLSTIPERAIQLIAEVLQREVATVLDYLSKPPALDPNANYKAQQAPSVTLQQNFFDAVRDDPELNDDDRNYWLSFKTPER